MKQNWRRLEKLVVEPMGGSTGKAGEGERERELREEGVESVAVFFPPSGKANRWR